MLCVAAIAAIGCGNAGPGLEDTARNISRRSSELMAGRASEESYAAATDADEEDDTDLAEDELVEDEMDEGAAGAAEEAAAGSEAPAPMGGLISDDSVHCGNGTLEVGEQCDIKIKEGEGVCPTECPQFDACHAGKLVIQGCYTRCEMGELIDC
jgi:hypothetical protein